MKDKPMQIRIEGYEVLEERAEPGGNSERIYGPKNWASKRVRAVSLDP